MATAVLDLDLERLHEGLEQLEAYDSALVLLRMRGRPVGQAVLSLGGTRLDAAELRTQILEGADSAFWEAWLRTRLELPEPAEATKGPSATVAICTRNRTDDLSRCLVSLLAMPDDAQDVLVVDNAPSNDDTRVLVQRHPRVRYVREDRPGLDVARNRALREARGEIVAFTDDDASVDPLWLRMLLRNFRDPLVMAATGLTMALELETSAQVMFERSGGFARGFRRKVFDAAAHDPLYAWHAGAGVSMALRRSATDHVGFFDEALDAGTPTHAGGDTDMFRRLLKAGYRIAYDPEALNWHRHRRSEAELARQLVGYQIAAFAIYCRALLFEGDLGAASHVVWFLRRELRNLAKSILRRPQAPALSSVLPRLRAALLGPGLYIYSRKRLG